MKITGRLLELLMTLSVRANEEFTGYELSKSLRIASGTLYPLLAKAEEAGLLRARWEDETPVGVGRPRRRYYQITGAGQQAVEQRTRQLGFAVMPLTVLSRAGVIE
jgi:DNA-binding PadR family transcriptional regulator